MAILDGPAKIGGSDNGIRPMEMILMGLAGCSSFDILSILEKTRQKPENFEVQVEGTRSEDIPAVYTSIHMHFVVSGDVQSKQLDKAISLSVEKYCSVARMLQKEVDITFSSEITQE
jgi:putative redox protein